MSARRLAVGRSGERLVARAYQRRGYRVVAQMQWSGHYDGRSPQQPLVMSPQEIEATSTSLSSYGAAVHMSDNKLVPPFLPARLGQTTGSDATLYVGGWTYVGKDGGGADFEARV